MSKVANLCAIFATLVLNCAFAEVYGPDNRSYECFSSSDCFPDECCTLGMHRYAYPTCNELRGLGSSCRPDNDAITFTQAYYPDGTTLNLTNIYTPICPCSSGLVCRHGVCELDQNYIRK
ncbi:Prokineticin [Nesidiocoris tenuis]|uniref:Prokineticin n=1 Tax=Nesidiocoris tenuis TaxID=355587 RepID=A0ABN7B4Y5_9HEMI|nr:Prokineticin [Nesidiocoris tenuis]